MGAFATAVKAVISLGGGQGYVTPHRNDVVYNLDLNDRDRSRRITPERAMHYIPFFAAVRNISEDVAGLPLNVYQRLPGGGRSRDSNHPVDRLLGLQPNPYMTAFTFRETRQAHVLTWGNGLAEIEFDTEGRPMGLWPLRPDRVEYLIDSRTGKPFYRYTLSDGQRVDLAKRNVLHIHGLGFDGLQGYSIVEIARRSLAMTLAAEKYGENWYDKGGLPKAVLIHPKTLSDTAKTNLRESVEANYSTLEGRQRIMLLEEGMSLEQIGVPAKDAAFLETSTDVRSLIATLFRMPPDMLQDINRSTSWGTGIEQQGIGYVKYTLRGWLTRWEQEGNMSLLAGDDRYLKHIVDALLRGDSVGRWNAYRQGLDLGVFNIDDVLQMEDRNPLPDGLGQQHFVQLNRAPLEQVGEMTMQERIEALGGLMRAGFQPAASTEIVGLPDIDHTGLEPVTVSDQGDFTKSNGKADGVRCHSCGLKVMEWAPSYRFSCPRCKTHNERAQSPVGVQQDILYDNAGRIVRVVETPA